MRYERRSCPLLFSSRWWRTQSSMAWHDVPMQAKYWWQRASRGERFVSPYKTTESVLMRYREWPALDCRTLRSGYAPYTEPAPFFRSTRFRFGGPEGQSY